MDAKADPVSLADDAWTKRVFAVVRDIAQGKITSVDAMVGALDEVDAESWLIEQELREPASELVALMDALLRALEDGEPRLAVTRRAVELLAASPVRETGPHIVSGDSGREALLRRLTTLVEQHEDSALKTALEAFLQAESVSILSGDD